MTGVGWLEQKDYTGQQANQLEKAFHGAAALAFLS